MKIHELLSDKSKWTQGVYARDASGTSVPPESTEAACWCLIGALHVCYPRREEWVNAVHSIRNKLPEPIAIWNDRQERTYEEVVDLLRKVDV